MTGDGTGREWRIGMSGTFDVQNFGDLLFPLIAEAELTRRLGSLRLDRFSYTRQTPPGWPFPVRALDELPAAIVGLDAMVIGGGHVIRFDKDVAPGYGPPSPTVHHPTGYWLGPALVALQHGVPVVWNAPGVHGDVPGWAESLVRLALGQSRYVAVRDEASRRALSRFAPVTVVPDTAFGIASLLAARGPSVDVARLRAAVGLGDRYVIVQAGAGLDAFWRFARAHAADVFRDLQVLVVEIGPAVGDDDARFGRDLPNAIRLPAWPGPLPLAALIAGARAAVGVSLHLGIVAVACGVPVFRPAGNAGRAGSDGGKYVALDPFETVATFPFDGNDIDPRWFAARIDGARVSPAARVATERLARHWDDLAAAVTGGAAARSDTLAAFARFWQALPNELETRSVRPPSIEARAWNLVARSLRAARRRLRAPSGRSEQDRATMISDDGGATTPERRCPKKTDPA